MKKKLFSKKFLSMLLVSSMVVGSVATMSGCTKKDDIITLDVYSQLANFSGEQGGWGADVLKEKLGIKINIIPDSDGTFETRMESGDLGDVVVWANDSTNYPLAVQNGLLFDWEDDDLLTDFGPDIKENMQDALTKNKELNKTITDGKDDSIYGFGHNVALSSQDHEAFFYTWDIRWDLYKELGYPVVNDLNDYEKLLKDMQKICPKDDSGNKVYAVSLWPDWDDAMVMYVKATATAYYGYDELALGLYDSQTGKFHDALEENGPYLEMLKFYNNLYQDGLVDPDSMTQTYDKMIEKVQNGGVLFSIFNYSGQIAYNTEEHTGAGKLMYPMKPENATPIVYGMNTQGGDRIWSIGAKSEYPEKAMELINFLCTPEGRMEMEYGPKGVTWDYDDDGHPYFTELGKKCQADKQNTKMGGDYKGTYHDGEIQINNTTWSLDAKNPESNGDTYNKINWPSENAEASSEIEQDWRDKTGATNTNTYMEARKYVVQPGTSFSKSSQDDTLKTTWNQVTGCIKTESWKAIYAKTDKEFDKIVAGMKKSAEKYGYEECKKWSENEAARKKGLEDALTK
ncbi:MAG: hypothetical protein Q4D32_01005 [Eubacteriales bacterium]|nr:hypothetical protein [Eubacteriales bacterium]